MKRLVLFHVISSALLGFHVSPAAARQPAKQVGRAADSSPTTVQHVRVDHGRANVPVGEHASLSPHNSASSIAAVANLESSVRDTDLASPSDAGASLPGKVPRGDRSRRIAEGIDPQRGESGQLGR